MPGSLSESGEKWQWSGRGAEVDWVHFAWRTDLTWYRGSGDQRERVRERLEGEGKSQGTREKNGKQE